MNEEINSWRERFTVWLQTNWIHTDSAHDIYHLHKVWSNAKQISLLETERGHAGTIDFLVLVTATYFHDLVSFPKNDPRRAESSRVSADKTAGLLSTVFEGFPAAKIAAIHHAIHAHSFSANVDCKTFEAKILQDADRLEALGANGIARLFYTAGKMNAAMYDAADPLALHRPSDDKQFALDHIDIKLIHLPGTMNTTAGKLLAEQEMAFVLAFRDKLVNEVTMG
jgi:uncharacterized protein